ncbi:tRNA (adenine-N(1)-)-methyltransferase catalytic subunit trm61 [Blastocladiella emersonii ATCC 22665]|nr:tRNA (adenine-N(1)-)-methyltransferase catalytic subunit trm61 [Blastocladiella emersonii ATCC 22665]
MTFATYTETIADGDWAILYRGHNDVHPVQIKAGTVLNNRAGSFKHDDFIGKPWGTRFGGHNGQGSIIILHPTPELWTLSLPHRTQILYQADISYITARLRLKPGCKVLESGTGSGSFSHSLIRSVAPTGHLYTFEYHAERTNAAREEFEAHGLSSFVTIECRDVCKNGFPLTNLVDAAFLDLPAPWEAVPSAAQALRRDTTTYICCFSPCIEQVDRTCDALRAAGFVDVTMVECLLRENDVRNVTLRTADAARTMKPQAKKVGVPAAEASPDVAVAATMLRPRNVARGHTSFLTFATMLPREAEAGVEA